MKKVFEQMTEMKKICKECGEEFSPKQKTQMFCNKTHYRKCVNPNCEKEFEVPRKRLNTDRKTCNNTCAAEYRKLNPVKVEERECRECGKMFNPPHFNDVYCQDQHMRKCEVCSKEFPVKKNKLSKSTPTCSPHCGAVYSHTEESNKKRKENNLKKYGVEYTFQREDVKKKIKESEGFQRYKFGSDEYKRSMLSKYGVDNGFLLPSANPNSISKLNLKWAKIIEEITDENVEFEKFFKNVGNIDLYVETNGMKLGIEISPTATHNSYKNLLACNRRGCVDFPCLKHGKNKYYHQNKVLELKNQHDVDLVTIFDWTSEDKMIEFIKSKLKISNLRIGAKKCSVKEITQKEANSFLKETHILGSSKKQTKCYGIFYNNELMSVSTFSPRDKENHWEAKRSSTLPGVQIIGGISKITKRFINDCDPEEIVSFIDLSLGFSSFDKDFNNFKRVEIQRPSKIWSKKDRMIKDVTAAYQSADRLIGISNNSKDSPYPEDWTNEMVFLKEGWLPVYDCGKIKDVWKKV